MLALYFTFKNYVPLPPSHIFNTYTMRTKIHPWLFLPILPTPSVRPAPYQIPKDLTVVFGTNLPQILLKMAGNLSGCYVGKPFSQSLYFSCLLQK
jgi:hypothetical protein